MTTYTIGLTDKELGHLYLSVLKAHGMERVAYDEPWDLFIPPSLLHFEPPHEALQPQSTQGVFGIRDNKVIGYKDSLWQCLVTAYGRGKAREMMPESWLAENQRDWDAFKEQFQPGDWYLMKHNKQRTSGIKFINSLEMAEGYRNWGYPLIQRFQTDSYTVLGHKMSLRLYVLFEIEGDTLKSYLHSCGRCIYSQSPLAPSEEPGDSWLTSYHLDNSIYDTHPQSLQEFREHVVLEGGSYLGLWESIKSLLSGVVEAVRERYGKQEAQRKGRFFDLYGVDFILTEEAGELRPALLEMNVGPSLALRNEQDFETKYRVLFDSIEVMRGGAPNGYQDLQCS